MTLTAAQPQPAGLSVESAVDLRVFANASMRVLALSPDGRFLAYTTRRETLDTLPPASVRTSTGMLSYMAGSAVFVTDLKTHTTTRVMAEPNSASEPAWSPDSRHLAFYGDEGGSAAVWVWNADTGHAARAATVRAMPVTTPSLFWTPDSRHLLARVDPSSGDTSPAGAASRPSTGDGDRGPAKPAVTVYTFEPHKGPEPKERPFTPNTEAPRSLQASVAHITIDTGAVRLVAQRIGPRFMALSPDGTRLMFTQPVGYDGNDIYRSMFDVHVVEVDTGRDTVVSPRARLSTRGSEVSWSPDSRQLAYIPSETFHRGDGRVADGQVYLVPADGSAPPHRATDAAHPDLGDTDHAPIWSADGARIYGVTPGQGEVWEVNLAARTARPLPAVTGKTITYVLTPATGNRVWSPSDLADALIVATRDDKTKREGFYTLPLHGGSPRALWEENVHLQEIHHLECDTTQAAGTVACVVEGYDRAPDAWVTKTAFREFQRVTHLNPAFEQQPLGTSQLLDWTDPDGQIVRGSLLLPPHRQPGTRLPLLVMAYPKRLYSDDVNSFADRGVALMQLFTSRGYAVLCADLPLRGRGPAHDIAAAILPGINQAVTIGVADADRIGVMGESGGGFVVMSLITQSPRFKAAVEIAGFADFMGYYGSMRDSSAHFALGWTEDALMLGGSPWNVRERYIENSPIFYLDRVQTPLLIVHGARDTSVSPQLGGEIFVGLRRLEKEVSYALYANEAHGIVTRANKIDMLNRIITWFDQHLSVAEPTATQVKR